MKNIYKRILTFTLALMAIIACTKDIEIDDTFDFDFTILKSNEAYLGQDNDWLIKIAPDKVITDVTYTLTYEIMDGQGVFTPYDDIVQHPIPCLDCDKIIYNATTPGLHKIRIFVTSSKGITKYKDYEINIIYQPFIFNFTAAQPTFYINTPGNLTATIFPGLTDNQNATYQFKYIVNNGTGLILNQLNVYQPATNYTIQSGTNDLTYMPSTLGQHTIVATATAEDGHEIERTVIVDVINIPFTFDVTSASTSVNINEELDILINLTDNTNNSLATYTIQHSYDPSGISGIIKDENQNIVQAGTYSPITLGTHQIKFKSSNVGVCKITFKAKDSNNQEKIKVLIINVTNIPFTFTAVPTSTNIVLNQPTAITFNLTQLTSNPTANYTFVYQGSNGNGNLTHPSGAVIIPGTPINVNAGAWYYNYYATTLGNHTLNFTVTDNAFGSQSVNATLDLVATQAPVTFNVSTLPQTYVNQTVPVNFVVTPEVSGITYQLNYILTSGQGILRKNSTTIVTPGTYENINTGAFSYTFQPTLAGNHTLQFVLKDSNNQTIIKQVTIEALNNTFTFTPTPSQTVFVNQNNVFNFALVPSGNYAANSYQMSYTVSSGNLGTFAQGSTIYQQGIPIAVTPTSYQLNYFPTTVGTHTINYTILDSNGLTVNYSHNVQVVSTNFNFTAQQSNTSIFKNVSDQVVLSVSPTQTVPGVTYTLSYNIVGVGGMYYSNGNSVPTNGAITPGNLNLFFKSNVAGTATVNFVLTDSNGTVNNASVSYTVLNTGFTFTTSGDGNLILNSTKDFSGYLTQSFIDPSTTYQVRYIISSGSVGNGEVYQNGTMLSLGSFYTINPGATQLQFKGTAAGLVNLLVEVKDSNNVIHSSIVVFNINSIGYTFTGSSQSNSLYVGETTPLNFDITETAPSGTSYEMKYVYTSGNGSVFNGGNLMAANVWQPVNIGSFSRSFTSTQTGQTKILFTSRNVVTLVEHSQEIIINNSTGTFTFQANNVTNNQQQGTAVPINFLLNELGNSSTYTMVFTTSGTGSLVYNGNSYTAGQPITVSPGSFSGTYIGNTSGNHNITFSVTNGNNPPIVKTSSIVLSFTTPDFILSTSGDGNLFLNGIKDFNVFLAQVTPDPSISYQVRYSYASGTTGTGEVQTSTGAAYTLGQQYPISIGNTSMKFKALTVGTVKLNVEIIDSNGLIHNSIIQFSNIIFNYTFSGAANNNSVNINQSTNLNFDITETSPSGTAYEIKYVITQGGCNILDGSNSLSPGIYYPTVVGSSSKTFVPTQPGTIKILFTSRNIQTLVEKTQLIQIDVLSTDFNVSTSGDTSLYLNQNSSFNVLLTQNIPDASVTYQVKYSYDTGTTGTGEIKNNLGNIQSLGTWYTINPGNVVMNYKALTVGVVKIKVEIKDSNNISHSSIVQFNNLSATFNFNKDSTSMATSQQLTTIGLSIDNETLPNDNYEMKYTFSNMNFVQNPNITSSQIVVKTIGNGIFDTATQNTLGTANVYYNIDSSLIQNIGNKTFGLWIYGAEYSTFTVNLTLRNSTGVVKTVTFDYIGYNPIIQNNNIMRKYGRQTNVYNGSTWELRYSICYNKIGNPNALTLPTNVKIYRRLTGTTNYTLMYSGPTHPSTDPNIANYTGAWEPNPGNANVLHEHRIEFTYANGEIYYQNLGSNYTCSSLFNGSTCFICN